MKRTSKTQKTYEYGDVVRVTVPHCRSFYGLVYHCTTRHSSVEVYVETPSGAGVMYEGAHVTGTGINVYRRSLNEKTTGLRHLK